jgi:hypothetical protein
MDKIYKNKYEKYKNKYLQLKYQNMRGGSRNNKLNYISNTDNMRDDMSDAMNDINNAMSDIKDAMSDAISDTMGDTMNDTMSYTMNDTMSDTMSERKHVTFKKDIINDGKHMSLKKDNVNTGSDISLKKDDVNIGSDISLKKDDDKTDNIICDPSKVIFRFKVDTSEFEFPLTVCKTNIKNEELSYIHPMFLMNLISFIKNKTKQPFYIKSGFPLFDFINLSNLNKIDNTTGYLTIESIRYLSQIYSLIDFNNMHNVHLINKVKFDMIQNIDINFNNVTKDDFELINTLYKLSSNTKYNYEYLNYLKYNQYLLASKYNITDSSVQTGGSSMTTKSSDEIIKLPIKQYKFECDDDDIKCFISGSDNINLKYKFLDNEKKFIVSIKKTKLKEIKSLDFNFIKMLNNISSNHANWFNANKINIYDFMTFNNYGPILKKLFLFYVLYHHLQNYLENDFIKNNHIKVLIINSIKYNDKQNDNNYINITKDKFTIKDLLYDAKTTQQTKESYNKITKLIKFFTNFSDYKQRLNYVRLKILYLLIEKNGYSVPPDLKLDIDDTNIKKLCLIVDPMFFLKYKPEQLEELLKINPHIYHIIKALKIKSFYDQLNKLNLNVNIPDISDIQDLDKSKLYQEWLSSISVK